jgi:hypothetical protein
LVERLSVRTTPRLRPEIWGPPPLLKGEDSAAFNKFLAKVIATVKPVDFLEEILVRDVVDIDWEIVRLRRLKSDLVNQAFRDKIKEALGRLQTNGNSNDDETDDENDEIDIDALASGWAVGDRAATRKVEEILKAGNVTFQDLLTRASLYRLGEIERIDRLIMTSEARRNATLREIDRHRQILGQQRRRVPEQIDDAKYEVVRESDQPTKIASQSR